MSGLRKKRKIVFLMSLIHIFEPSVSYLSYYSARLEELKPQNIHFIGHIKCMQDKSPTIIKIFPIVSSHTEKLSTWILLYYFSCKSIHFLCSILHLAWNCFYITWRQNAEEKVRMLSDFADQFQEGYYYSWGLCGWLTWRVSNWKTKHHFNLSRPLTSKSTEHI